MYLKQFPSTLSFMSVSFNKLLYLLGNLLQVLPPSQDESAVSHDADASQLLQCMMRILLWWKTNVSEKNYINS